MFLENYLSEDNYIILVNKYDEEFLRTIRENNFLIIYELLINYNFYFIEDVIVNYLEIFNMDYLDVLEKILLLKIEYGDDFVFKIGENMLLLEKTLEDNF